MPETVDSLLSELRRDGETLEQFARRRNIPVRTLFRARQGQDLSSTSLTAMVTAFRRLGGSEGKRRERIQRAIRASSRASTSSAS